MHQLDVCLCTYNPRRDILNLVCQSLADQTLDKDLFKVWIIDNYSEPTLIREDFYSLINSNVNFQIIREERPGLSYARLCAIESTSAPLITFVDDDNELHREYLDIAIEIAGKHPEIGCFGGKLLLPNYLEVPPKFKSLLPYLGIHDKGDSVISECADTWGLWEPPGAGATVRRDLAELYTFKLKDVPAALQLGRASGSGLLSGDDSLLMRGAYYLNYQCSYQPRLQLTHHISKHRLTWKYLVRLMYNYGRSYVILERALNKKIPKISSLQISILLSRRVSIRIIEKIKEKRSLSHTFCMIAWDIGYANEVNK